MVEQPRQDPNFTTTLSHASFGGAVTEGFIYSSLADYAIDGPSVGAKRIDALSNSLRTVVVDAKLIAHIKDHACVNCRNDELSNACGCRFGRSRVQPAGL